MPYTVLITGTSSGLGLAFLKHFVAMTPQPDIIALDTQPFPDNLAHLVRGGGKVILHKVDITSERFIRDLAVQLSHVAIHLVIHCAGVRGLVPSIVAQQKTGHVPAAESLNVMDHATMMRTLEINTWGTFSLLRSFLPNLRLAAEDSSLDVSPKVVIMSSRMGSVASNSVGGAYAYRASKAALNAVVKSFSVDVPDVVFSLLHPGRVETGLVEWKEEGAISVEESLQDCLKIIEGLKSGDSGKLVDRFGVEIVW